MAESKIIITKDLMDKVIEELTEYRAIGTIEELKRLKALFGNENSEMPEIATKILKEYPEYLCIGTVEEFKALKEKSEPKKPDIEKFWGYDDLMCPGCKSYFVGEPNYCCKCGQAIDWQ